MLKMNDVKMKPKLIVLFLLAGLIPLLLLGWWSSQHAADALMQSSFNQLEGIRGVKKHQIEEFFHERLHTVEIMAKSADTHKMYDELHKYHVAMDVQTEGAYDTSTPEYAQIWKEKSGDLTNYMHKYGYQDVFIICAKHGHVMYTAAKEADIGTNLKYGPYKDSGLARLWSRVVGTQKAVFQDFAPYAPSNNEPASFVGYPRERFEWKSCSGGCPAAFSGGN